MSRKKIRAAGILLPVSSLPSPYGIGTFGAAAYNFADFLAEAGQKYWQILPLGPTSYGDSPYQSFSAFAGNPYFVDLDKLCEEKLLTAEECAAKPWGKNSKQVDYATIFHLREPLLRLAFSRFKGHSALKKFRAENAGWIEDYALYMAVKAKMELKSWTEWDEDIRLRKPDALKKYERELKGDVDYHIFVQYMFFKQWSELKAYVNSRGVKIIGDIPIYVSLDSADVWANGEFFLLDENRLPIDVAGCPPDYFSADGQLWGNPLYRWDVLKADGYDWWMKRLDASLLLYDVLRIDHFRGLESYYAIPFGSKNARTGEWRKGPGMDFIGEVHKRFGTSNIIAEDLGFMTRAVQKLLRDSKFPGMKVLEFAFDAREQSDYMPHNYSENCVVYTGTHDNDTIRGWLETAKKADVKCSLDYLGSSKADANWAFIRAAFSSVGRLAIVPMQDYLDLGSSARINIPSTVGGNNWRWRMSKTAASKALAKKIARLTRLYGR